MIGIEVFTSAFRRDHRRLRHDDTNPPARTLGDESRGPCGPRFGLCRQDRPRRLRRIYVQLPCRFGATPLRVGTSERSDARRNGGWACAGVCRARLSMWWSAPRRPAFGALFVPSRAVRPVSRVGWRAYVGGHRRSRCQACRALSRLAATAPRAFGDHSAQPRQGAAPALAGHRRQPRRLDTNHPADCDPRPARARGPWRPEAHSYRVAVLAALSRGHGVVRSRSGGGSAHHRQLEWPSSAAA